MRRPVCILRERQELVALVLPEDDGATGLLRLPLRDLTDREVPGRSALLTSWEALALARGATAETLTHVLRVLLATVAGDEAPPLSLGHPWLTPPPERPRRTAAHPRGYRGTLDQPPKRPQPAVLDVRPYLLHSRTLGALLEPLRPSVADAIQLLEAQGYARERLALVAQALTASARADVALAYRHGVLDVRGATLPPSFVRLGCLLANGPEGSFGRLLALRGRLAIDTQAPVLTAAARLLSHFGPAAGLPWLELAARLVPEAQLELLSALLQVDGPRPEASAYDAQVEPFVLGSPKRWEQYLRGLAAGLQSDYLLSGFRLLKAHGLDETLSLPSTGGPVPEECLTELFAHLRPATSARYFLQALWTLCGELPGFSDTLTSLPWTRLSPRVASGLVRLLDSVRDPFVEPPVWRRRWSAARRVLPPLLRLLERTADSHQERCVHMVYSLMAFADTPWERPAHQVSAVLALAERLCRPPLSPLNCLSYALEPLVRHPSPEVQRRLLAAPDSSFLHLEASCSRGDREGLVGDGLKAMVSHDVGFVLDALEHFPTALARTARLLGTLRRNEAWAVLAEFSRHPLVRDDPFKLPPDRLAALLQEHCTKGVESPLPRKARTALAQGQGLPPGQLARALRVASAQLPRVRLQVLTRTVLARLRGGLPADVDMDDARVRHALQMATLIHHNRRALRRMLARYFAGERDFIVRHSASRAWFARHPRVDPRTWLAGVVLRRALPGLGEVTLELEQDALEALRLGTYVGSCLGINGSCDYAAAAVVLDVNKRVLYARDARGRVLARQLLAISEHDTLVPFSVYPENTPPALQALFLDYDLAFAEALGLPLCDGPSHPSVEFVLSTDFWHDGAWDLGGPPEEDPEG
jgi:hypothetical protein